jgi:hypothetical protein
MNGTDYCLRIALKAKQLLNCPLEGKKINVRLKWGKHTLWGGQRNETSSEPCINRKVLWGDDKNTFEYECKVYLENSMPNDPESRDRLFKRQPSSARLSISVSRSVRNKNQSLVKICLCRSVWSLIVFLASIENTVILAVGRF